MKAAFGLVGILVTVGVIVWIMGMSGGSLDHVQNVKKAGDTAAADVRQLGGTARDGSMSFKESITLDGQQSGGKTVALLVEKVEATGPAFTFFGLKRGDLITSVGQLTVKDNITGGDDGIGNAVDAFEVVAVVSGV